MKPAQRSISNPVFRLLHRIEQERVVPEDKMIARVNFPSPLSWNKRIPLKPVKQEYAAEHHEDYNPNAVVSGQVPLNRNW